MATQLVEKEVFVNMKALEEEAAVSCWRPGGARTDPRLGLIRECAWWLVALAYSFSYRNSGTECRCPPTRESHCDCLLGASNWPPSGKKKISS